MDYYIEFREDLGENQRRRRKRVHHRIRRIQSHRRFTAIPSLALQISNLGDHRMKIKMLLKKRLENQQNIMYLEVAILPRQRCWKKRRIPRCQHRLLWSKFLCNIAICETKSLFNSSFFVCSHLFITPFHSLKQ